MLAFSFYGCTAKPSGDIGKASEKKVVEIQWEFNTHNDKQNYDTPKTTIYLNINDGEKKRIKIGEYIANFEEVTPENCSWELPKDSLTSCFGWFAGQGNILGITRTSPDSISIIHKFIEESGGDPEFAEELETRKFEEISIIKIDKDAEISVKKAILVND